MRTPLIASSLLVSLVCVSRTEAQATRAPTRICLGPTSVESAVGNAGAATSAVREGFAGFLTGPGVSAAPLEARLVSQARLEAATAGCPYLLLTSVKHTRKSGGGFLAKVAGSAAQQGAWAVTSSVNSTTGRIVAGVAAGAATAAALDYASSTKSHDELSLTSRLEAADGRVLFEATDKRKARTDGEDMLTPIVQKHAESMVAAVAAGR